MRRVTLLGITLAVLLVTGAAVTILIWRQHRPENDAGAGGHPFHLMDQNAAPVSDASFRGKWVLLYFGYTHCPDICPTSLATMSAALEAMGEAGKAVQPVFITLDPERDTPAILKDYTAGFDPRLRALTGTEDEIAALARSYRISYDKQHGDNGDDYGIDHSSVIFLLDPDGRIASLFAEATPPERMAARIGEMVAGVGTR